MKKIFLVIALVLIMTSVACARDGHHGHHRGHYQGHHHGYNHHNNSIAPWVLGGAALGLLGAGVYMSSRPYQSCWSESKQVWDHWGNYLGWRDVRICN